MKKFFSVVVGIAAFVGILALSTPASVAAKNGPVCKTSRRCYYEPDTTCPPCYELAPCAPHCGCRPIPSCRP
jgi:hypothetical protein